MAGKRVAGMAGKWAAGLEGNRVRRGSPLLSGQRAWQDSPLLVGQRARWSIPLISRWAKDEKFVIRTIGPCKDGPIIIIRTIVPCKDGHSTRNTCPV
ncbi:hypothetical protein OROMI_031545 [Orobanche minor]